jgi:hypothetical protein
MDEHSLSAHAMCGTAAKSCASKPEALPARSRALRFQTARKVGDWLHVPYFDGWKQAVTRMRLAHSTVTLFARLRGLSTSVPFTSAAWYASSCSGMTCSTGDSMP